MGVITYLTEFIPDSAHLLEPLRALDKELTSSGRLKFVFNDVQRAAFVALKRAACSADRLVPYDRTKEVIIDCDASKTWGAAIIHHGDGNVIAFLNRAFNATQLKYPVHERELLIIQWVLVRYEKELLYAQAPITFVTDNKSLDRFETQLRHAADRITRVAIYVTRFAPHLRIKWRPEWTDGPHNLSHPEIAIRPTFAALASGLPLHSGNGYTALHHMAMLPRSDQLDVMAVSATPQPIVAHNPMPLDWYARLSFEAYEQDPALAPLAPYVRAKFAGTALPVLKGTDLALAKRITCDNTGVWFNQGVYGHQRIVIPHDMRHALLVTLHDYYAHPSGQQLFNIIAERYWAPKLRDECIEFAHRCDTCIAARRSHNQVGFNGRYDNPVHPFHQAYADIFPGLALNEQGHDAVLLLVDALTGYTLVEGISTNANSGVMMRMLEDMVEPMFGTMSILTTDNGSTFTSAAMVEWAAKRGCQLQRSTPGHHVANVERVGQEFRKLFASMVGHDGVWTRSDILRIQRSLNAMPSQAPGGDGLCPSERLLGYRPPAYGLGNPVLIPGLEQLHENRERGWSRPSLQALADAKQQQVATGAEVFDRHRVELPFHVGAIVALRREDVNSDYTRIGHNQFMKSRSHYISPFQVVQLGDGGNLHVDLDNDKPPVVVHRSRVKLLPDDAMVVPPQPDQPAQLRWANGAPKARMAINSRVFHGKKQHLVVYWGQHESRARWRAPQDLRACERHLLLNYDERAENRVPTRVPRAPPPLRQRTT